MRPSASNSETVARIHDVGFFSLNSNSWDTLSTGLDSLSNTSDQLNDISQRDTYPNAQSTMLEHPCASLMKILSMGTFYYAVAPQWDLSSRLSRRISKEKRDGNDYTSYDERFIWNEYIVRSLLDFRTKLDSHERDELDKCQFIVSPLDIAMTYW